MLFEKYILLRKPDDHFQKASMKIKALEAEVYLACARNREEGTVLRKEAEKRKLLNRGIYMKHRS